MEAAEAEEQAAAAELDQILAGIPNLPADDVPDGADDDANVEIRRYGNAAQLRLRAQAAFRRSARRSG